MPSWSTCCPIVPGVYWKSAGSSASRQLAVRDPQREERILGRIVRNNQGPLANDAVARIFETIIHECIRLEEQLEEKQGLAGGCSPGSL